MAGIGNNTITQVALVVRDIEATARAYADVFDVDVPTILETESADETNIRYRGKTTAGRAKLAFFDMGSVSLELIEPIGGPSTWQEHLDAHGEGIHHIAFQVEGTDQVVARLEGKGCQLVQTGEYPGGRYAYVDATDKLKLVLELLENTGR
jgi:catechol 2,3-dioxygenase-like lactoylglutathione lyase family enzyme